MVYDRVGFKFKTLPVPGGVCHNEVGAPAAVERVYQLGIGPVNDNRLFTSCAVQAIEYADRVGQRLAKVQRLNVHLCQVPSVMR
jgi:hypothetical protein